MLLAVAAGLAGCSVGGDTRPAPCGGLHISSWSQDHGVTDEFARYGDDASHPGAWTGGDGTHSVRLPDGRTLWLADDPVLDPVYPPPNPLGQPYPWRDTTGGRTPVWAHNAVLVMSAAGRLERTLPGGTPAAPAAYFPDPSAVPQVWRWPVQGVVEPRSPGAAEQVVRILLWDRVAGPPPWLYGVPLATEVATLSLPGLRLESIVQVSDQSAVPSPGRRVLYGAGAVHADGWTYVFGGDDGPGRSPALATSQAYLARVPQGRLADPSAWRYWNGTGWQASASRAVPVLGGGEGGGNGGGNGNGRRGVGSSLSVVRQDGTWVLFTMDAGGPAASGLSAVATYWACAPQGPWHGPAAGFRPPLPQDTSPQSAAVVYNPQIHAEFTRRDGLLLSYDVNWLGTSSAQVGAEVNRNAALYRPRFVRLRLGPVAASSGPSASSAGQAPAAAFATFATSPVRH
ncbi:DUF4185 domain-containing protein [Streptomyces sp. H10-C2]|uniref:DUF4185 domain-containing protein n=1 Tax=unclassified Streptomyces TaxID=2593676 RepID=UPI0024B9DB89|nr:MULTISPECIES: DUF4185 domain-containing protein [unclassified Streptomyces]MDJ0347195.1 DUF4185 domain-containing protein [Streptomyces sp. PH10-H1]MDJ0370332.1 DUF4185 domain-containing protein [Streptomyces sp. H10-C2]